MRDTPLNLILLILLQSILSNNCDSQELSVSSNFKKKLDSTEIIIIGEIHSKKNASHKSEIVKFLSHEKGNKYVAIEAPRIMQIYANDYIEKGRSEAKKLFSKSIYIRFRKDYVAFLDSIRNFNNKVDDSSKIIVKCFDLQSKRDFVSFDDINDLIDYLDEPELSVIDNLINNLELSVELRQDKLYKELLGNESSYKQIMSSSTFYSLLDYVRGVEIINNNGKVRLSNNNLSKKREQFISENIENLFRRNKMNSLVIFAGDFHISKLENDDWLEHSTLAFKLSKTFKTLSVLTIYSEDSNFPYNLFNYDYTEILKVEYEELASKYNSSKLILFSEDDEPQEEIFWKRYDGLLLKFK